ncbi:hypothetical protein LWI30_04055 [Staphylococcus epidermidis]|uniref:hypothetical protein n=1 Tax=Staphylococcus epidermidis TaxID=1282 RepID=UPI001E2E8DF0|nr:hypothetical protein [Staphylococcus epidermidis]MCG3213557.1 hypothetical protein [Staphylococcus epidermidis]
MNFKTNFKGLFSIEKKFNVNLLPSQLKLEDKINIFWSTLMRVVGWLLYTLLIASMTEVKNNNIIIYISCILIVVLLIFDISSIFLISDDMRKKNYRYLFIKRGEEYYRLDKFFYDISDKQVLQYTVNEKDMKTKKNNGDSKNDKKEKIVGKKIVTEKIDSDKVNTFIQTDSEATYSSKYITGVPIFQNIILIISIILTAYFHKHWLVIICLIVYFLINGIFTLLLSSNVNETLENNNIKQVKNEVKNHFNEDENDNVGDKKDSY